METGRSNEMRKFWRADLEGENDYTAKKRIKYNLKTIIFIEDTLIRNYMYSKVVHKTVPVFIVNKGAK